MSRALRLVAMLVLLAAPSPLLAQGLALDPAIAVRPFFLFSQQRFAASETLDATLGGSSQPFVGLGAQFLFGGKVYADVALSHFSKEGERAFRFEGENFGLGIPVNVSMTPVEVSAGLRFPVGAARSVVPYVGVGVGSYKYTETSNFADPADDVSLRHTGFLVVGGAEFRVYRWISASADVQFTQVKGIFGDGGISQAAGEENAGGVAARFRVMIGR